MHNLYNFQFHKILYIPIFILIVLFGIFYRYQIKIDDKQFLKGMIEHHSMALLMSDEIKKKSNDNDVITLANNIIKSQNKEIELMKKMLNEKNNIESQNKLIDKLQDLKINNIITDNSNNSNNTNSKDKNLEYSDYKDVNKIINKESDKNEKEIKN